MAFMTLGGSPATAARSKTPHQPLDYAVRIQRALADTPQADVLSRKREGARIRSGSSPDRTEAIEVAQDRKTRGELSQRIEALTNNGAYQIDVTLSVFARSYQAGALKTARLLHESCERLTQEFGARGCIVAHSFSAISNQYAHPSEVLHVGVRLTYAIAPF